MVALNDVSWDDTYYYYYYYITVSLLGKNSRRGCVSSEGRYKGGDKWREVILDTINSIYELAGHPLFPINDHRFIAFRLPCPLYSCARWARGDFNIITIPIIVHHFYESFLLLSVAEGHSQRREINKGVTRCCLTDEMRLERIIIIKWRLRWEIKRAIYLG